MPTIIFEPAVLAKMIVNTDRMPLTDENRSHVVTWLRQMADQYERGELFYSQIFELRIPEKKK